MNYKVNKHCPRCNFKVPIESGICPSCQLNYQKFESATNLEAKQAMHAGEKDQVLMRKGRPQDVSFVKLLLITIFLGYMGGHYYYVGRTKKGIFFTCFFVVGVANAIITTLLGTTPTGIVYEWFTLLVFVWGFVLLMWIIDIAKVCLNTFKIPVSIYKED